MIDPSLKSDIYDINNMVSLGFHPSSIRRNVDVDTTSWRNQSNILIPESKCLFNPETVDVVFKEALH